MLGERLRRAHAVHAALGVFFAEARVPIIVVDATGTFVTANDAAVGQYGWSVEELVEMRIHDFMALPRAELAEDLRRAHQGDGVELARRAHRRRDGTVAWVVPRAGPVEVCGETYIVSALQDVTAVVDAEDETHREHDRAEVVWDAAVEGFGSSFALFDADRRIVKANHTLATWLDTSEAAMVGRPCSEMFTSRCAAGQCPHLTAMVERRRVVEEFVTGRGRPIRLEVWPAPPNDAGIATIHVAHDLSEERALRSRLATADRLANLGRIAAGVAHEVNNPAAFVTLALPMVRERLTQGRIPEAMALLEEAAAAMQQINEVMHEIGDVAKDRPRAVVDLAHVVDGALRIASLEATSKARVVRLLEEGVVTQVRGPRLAQVVLNLVLNAAQAIRPGHPERNRIEVSLRSRDDRAIIQVADSGPGVPPEVAERLFQPFFTTRAHAGGTGLGLWLSRSIVEEEGGALTWRNRPEGGAVFTVELPLGRASPTLAAASAS